MLLTIGVSDRISQRKALRAMFEARKHVFVDRLKWDITVLDGRYEIDRFDDADARYLVILDGAGRHAASARLLPTTKPALLDTLFSKLCDNPLPHGETIFEITRFCLSPFISPATRKACCKELVIGLVTYARANGITTYTGVADPLRYAQLSQFGWATSLLGATQIIAGHRLAPLRIDIDEHTLAKLQAVEIHPAPL